MKRQRHRRTWWRSQAVLFVLLPLLLTAQCTTTISTFPYIEDFEAGPAWTAGGTNSDWAWGEPAHPVISSAANGNRAWCVGGLTGSFYSNGQQSWLETPCFDLSTLTNPWLGFSIWWETELNYDGVGLQYSPNGGTTWVNLGAAGNAEDCHTRYWFNSANITALNQASPRQGWSGNSTTGGCATGGGSNGYVPAAHCLRDLPTNAPVKFRFIFGAGTICNTFDGIAIDEVFIGEAPALTPAFNYSCAGSTVNFNATGLPGCVENGTWDFGDPDSGASNTGAGVSVAHLFSGPGAFTVSFTMTSSCSEAVTVQRSVLIGALDFAVTDVGCTPNSGAVAANITGAAGPFTYDWEPGGEVTQTIEGLSPGTYTVLVQATDMCPVQASATVGTDGTNITATAVQSDISCAGANDGSAIVTVSGGSGTYTFQWSPSGGNSAAAVNLAPGGYTCEVEDEAGCSTQVQVTIAEPTPVVVTAMGDVSICAGESITLTAAGSGGVGNITYTWGPAGPLVAPLATTTYQVQASDANGCSSASDDVVVTVIASFVPDLAWDIDSGCAPLCVTFTDASAVQGLRSWSFDDGGTAGDVSQPQHCFAHGGTFGVTLTITTSDGCSGSYSVEDVITVFPAPSAYFTSSPTVAMVDAPVFQFTSGAPGLTTWHWAFGDPLYSTSDEPSPTFTYADVGCYTVVLEVENDGGCTASAETEVCVEDAFALYAPNSFTPNGDGFNDVFLPATTVQGPKHYELSIFDRWGRELYTTANAMRGWDGTAAPPGVYLWMVSLQDREGRTQKRQGHVTLLQ